MKNTIAFFFLLLGIPVFAQSPCDDLTIESVQYNPFSDTIVYVSVVNSGAEIFSYPNFMLINSDGDTVANESVNFFGIGAESLHPLNVYAGAQNPQQPFIGELELHVGFQDSLACSWSLNQSLCASTTCDTVFIGLENWGGALVVGDFSWEVTDENQAVVESGTFSMPAENQSWVYGVYLSPGTYTYNLTALSQPSGGGPHLTVSSSRNFGAAVLSEPLDWFNNPGGELEFPFFEFCSENPNSISETNSNSSISVLRNGEEISFQTEEIIKTLAVFSIDGKQVHSSNPNSNQTDFPNHLPKGIYLVEFELNTKTEAIKVLR